MREHIAAWAEWREATTLSRILKSVRRRTISLKEEGESYESLPGLSRTIPSAFLREGGGNPWASRGSRREGRREGLMRCTDFHTEYGIWSRPGAEVLEDLERALGISSEVRGV